MVRRLAHRAAGLLIACALACSAWPTAAGAQDGRPRSGPEELWRAYPLEPEQRRRTTAAQSAPPARRAPPGTARPAPADGGGAPLLLVVLGALGLGLAAVAVLVARGELRVPRVRALAGEAGTLTPLAPVRPRRDAPPEAEPQPEDVDEPDWMRPPDDDWRPGDPLPAPVVAVPRAAEPALVFQVGWRVAGEEGEFGLLAPGRRSRPGVPMLVRSPAFPVDAPGAPSRRPAAEEALTRLRDALEAEGWRPVGRGRQWYALRFRPPEEA